ncbi:hypothetical protein AAX26_02021 [Aliarcobacter thereius]|uniref:hypothetical protein n=1 Tax=Aliarcobacter thereius TaxID=544718 RepID=UPI000828BC3A|nr:hypothetical protein [Aliarcobacter thereius]OCL85349.1 hypothetical protein AAX26_02021 [Aliarcobacter thereius]
MRVNIIKFLVIILILGFFTSCGTPKSGKGTYTDASYFEPLRYENNGGHMTLDSERIIFKIRLNDDESNKEVQELFAEIPYIAYWKIVRNPLGMKPDYSICGERPRLAEYKLELGKEYRKKEREYYDKKDTEYRECTANVTDTFDSKTVYKYYYAKMRQVHKVIYPKKSDMYYRWNINYYIGGVNDLAIEAVPEKYRENLDKLRSHKCHKWGASANHTCYDLPNGDKNIYYGLREEQYIIEEGKKVPKNRYPMDVRISEPIDWVEIEGIEINKDMFDYLEKVCERTYDCNLNVYKGELTEEQRDYIEAVKWDKDRVYEEKLTK